VKVRSNSAHSVGTAKGRQFAVAHTVVCFVPPLPYWTDAPYIEKQTKIRRRTREEKRAGGWERVREKEEEEGEELNTRWVAGNSKIGTLFAFDAISHCKSVLARIQPDGIPLIRPVSVQLFTSLEKREREEREERVKKIQITYSWG
jgi:hypothetical protein